MNHHTQIPDARSGTGRSAPGRRRGRVRGAAMGLIAASVALSMVASSCGDDDKDSTAAPASTTATTSAPTTAPAQSAGPASKADVDAFDYGYDGVPATVAVGAKFSLKNSSAKEVHEMVVFKVPDSEKRSAKDLLALPQSEQAAIFAGAPAMVVVAPPSAAGFAVVGDGTVKEAGRYVAFCPIPTGADPTAYMSAAAQSKGGPVSVPGGAPHFTSGMYAEFQAE